MAKRGPPTTYKPEHCDLARKFCMLGATNEDLGVMFDVTRRTIDYWIADNPDFAAAVRAGREIADATIVESLYARARGFSHPAVKIMQHAGQPLTVPYTRHYPPDTRACEFWLRNRRPQNWRQKIEPEPAEDPDWLTALDAAGERALAASIDYAASAANEAATDDAGSSADPACTGDSSGPNGRRSG